MTALEAMHIELSKVTNRMNECVTDSGFVKSECRYEYQRLVEKHKDIREGIEFLESLYHRI